MTFVYIPTAGKHIGIIRITNIKRYYFPHDGLEKGFKGPLFNRTYQSLHEGSL